MASNVITMQLPESHSSLSSTTADPKTQQLLRDSVTQALEHYFSQLDDQPIKHLYDLVLAEIELPLLRSVLRHVKGNQTKAADMLGLSRGTLRKKLRQYHLDD